MRHLTDAVRLAVSTQNWYAALALALTLPDICGRIEYAAKLGPEGSGPRFVKWWDRYAQQRYSSTNNGRTTVLLDGRDAYALRCAFLHEGSHNIGSQKARVVLTRFQFLPPTNGIIFHFNRFNRALQLQIDIFCIDIANGVDAWEISHQGNAAVLVEIAKLGKIGTSLPGDVVEIRSR